MLIKLSILHILLKMIFAFEAFVLLDLLHCWICQLFSFDLYREEKIFFLFFYFC